MSVPNVTMCLLASVVLVFIVSDLPNTLPTCTPNREGNTKVYHGSMWGPLLVAPV